MTTHELAQELLALKELPFADETSLREARRRLGIKHGAIPESEKPDEYGLTPTDYDPYNG